MCPIRYNSLAKSWQVSPTSRYDSLAWGEQISPFVDTFLASCGHMSHSLLLLSLAFIFNLQRIVKRLQVNMLPTPDNVKRHTTIYQRPIFNCSLQLRLTEMLASGAPRHLACSSTGLHFCQSGIRWENVSQHIQISVLRWEDLRVVETLPSPPCLVDISLLPLVDVFK